MLKSINVLSATSFVLIFIPRTVSSGPSWECLDSRQLPDWYDDAKFGIFIHWGVYSVPGFGSEWFWKNWHNGEKDHVHFMSQNYAPKFSYANFAQDFKAEFFDPELWAEIFEHSGAKYVVLTSKHHDGYTLWPSRYSFNWNSVDVGPRRDLVSELQQAIRMTNLRFGLYYSLMEYFNPLYLSDKDNNFSSNLYPSHKSIPELRELVLKYEPEILWSDGDWDTTSDYWESKEFLGWLFTESPVKDEVVVNDRWGKDANCAHGDFLTCEDHFNPGHLMPRKWENCLTIDKHSWGYRRNTLLKDYRDSRDIIRELVETVSCGGNLLLNVGPTSDGMIPVLMVERLRSIGKWLKTNGEGIFNTKPWVYQQDELNPTVWFTSRISDSAQTVYAFGFEWPRQNILQLSSPRLSCQSEVTMLGYNCSLKWAHDKEELTILFPDISDIPDILLVNSYVWCIKMTDTNPS